MRQKLHFCQLLDSIWILFSKFFGFVIDGLSQYSNLVMKVSIINHIDNIDKEEAPDMEKVESKFRNLQQIYFIFLTNFMPLVSFYTP